MIRVGSCDSEKPVRWLRDFVADYRFCTPRRLQVASAISLSRVSVSLPVILIVAPEPERKEQVSRERRKLEDMGYRVIVIRYDKSLAEQIIAHADVFGRGLNR
jgi:hypothetical protein